MKAIRLGINIDHVATLRNARGGNNPCPLRAAELVARSDADSITIHLREDRRHIRDADVHDIIDRAGLPVNLEMALTDEMLAIALQEKPAYVCFVPEKREELTTEGGLNASAMVERLKPAVAALKHAGIGVSLFVEPDTVQIDAAHATGADAVELHTGTYANQFPNHGIELERIKQAAKYAAGLRLNVHAGHGLTFENVQSIAAIPDIEELNIGHFLIGEALFTGLDPAISHMKRLMLEVR
jgi:pyridoxine 5-phosphate synthase